MTISTCSGTFNHFFQWFSLTHFEHCRRGNDEYNPVKEVRAHCYCAFFRACHAYVMHHKTTKVNKHGIEPVFDPHSGKGSFVASWDSCGPRSSRKCRAMT